MNPAPQAEALAGRLGFRVLDGCVVYSAAWLDDDSQPVMTLEDVLLLRLARLYDRASTAVASWEDGFDLRAWLVLGAEVDALHRELRAASS